MSTVRRSRRRFEMPFLLQCGLGLSALFAALGTVVLAITAVTVPSAASYNVNGHPVTRAEFLHVTWPLLAELPPLLGLFAAIGYALWRERRWARPLMLAFWGVNVLAGVALALTPLAPETGGAWAPAGVYVVILVVAWWYLYRKPSVVAYYRLLEEQAAAGASGRQGEFVEPGA